MFISKSKLQEMEDKIGALSVGQERLSSNIDFVLSEIKEIKNNLRSSHKGCDEKIEKIYKKLGYEMVWQPGREILRKIKK